MKKERIEKEKNVNMKNRFARGCSIVTAMVMLTGCAQGAPESVETTEQATETETTEQATETEATEQAAETEATEQAAETETTEQATYQIDLAGSTATINGEEVTVYDYTWHCDPTVVHTDVEDAPAEYYTGEKPQTEAPVYIDQDLNYLPYVNESDFSRVRYDDDYVWAYYYQDGVNDEYIFATLPVWGNTVPTQMMHTEEEAAENKVLHITEAGTYILSGEWDGQILVDLGDEQEVADNPDEKVTIVLDNASITCSVAPGIIFENVYESNTSDQTGANIVLADGSVNTISGTNVARMLKNQYKKDASGDIKEQKKMRKIDGSLYSYMSMTIDGESVKDGTLTVDSNFEGIDSEMHLVLNGGIVTINSQDDGINVNEDDVSVVYINDGNITINAGLGQEGDGIDSNGSIIINGGTIEVNGVREPDSALDSATGIYYNAGTVIIDGETKEYNPGDEFSETGRMGMRDGQKGQMPDGQMPDGMHGMRAPEDFDIKQFKEDVAALGDDATFEDVLSLLGMNR